MSESDGVLPDEVIRDPRASSWLIFVDVADTLGAAGAQAWLQAASSAVSALTASQLDGVRVASVVTAIGPSFPTKAGIEATRVPRDLLNPPALPASVPAAASHDVLFYVLSTSDAAAAQFLRALDATRPLGLTSLHLDRGYQRGDGRETFGLRDGLRNVPTDDRRRIVFLDPDDEPGEPDWATGGSYLAYLKIRQNLATWNALSTADHEQIVGRRDDGSRLDLPAGTDPTAEPPFSDPVNPPANSHVRKAGPRGADQDPVAIFRRGTPYIATADDGTLDVGLQFISFQASLDAFTTILTRWMLNTGFPTANVGVDALADPARNLITILAAGFYFALPHDDRYLGAGMFDPDTRNTSHLVIRKTILDPTGTPDPTASLEGATFQVTITATGEPVGNPFHTDAAGHARSGPLPIAVPLTVTETTAPAGANPGSAQQVTLDCHPLHLDWPNTRTSPPGSYGT